MTATIDPRLLALAFLINRDRQLWSPSPELARWGDAFHEEILQPLGSAPDVETWEETLARVTRPATQRLVEGGLTAVQHLDSEALAGAARALGELLPSVPQDSCARGAAHFAVEVLTWYSSQVIENLLSEELPALSEHDVAQIVNVWERMIQSDRLGFRRGFAPDRHGVVLQLALATLLQRPQQAPEAVLEAAAWEAYARALAILRSPRFASCAGRPAETTEERRQRARAMVERASQEWSAAAAEAVRGAAIDPSA